MWLRCKLGALDMVIAVCLLRWPLTERSSSVATISALIGRCTCMWCFAESIFIAGAIISNRLLFDSLKWARLIGTISEYGCLAAYSDFIMSAALPLRSIVSLSSSCFFCHSRIFVSREMYLIAMRRISFFESFLSGGCVGTSLRSSANAPETFCWRHRSREFVNIFRTTCPLRLVVNPDTEAFGDELLEFGWLLLLLFSGAPKWTGTKWMNELNSMNRFLFSHLKEVKYSFLPWDRNSSSSLSFSEKSDKSASDIESWLADKMEPFWLLLVTFVWFAVAADTEGDKSEPFGSAGVLADEAVEQRSLLVSSISVQSIIGQLSLPNTLYFNGMSTRIHNIQSSSFVLFHNRFVMLLSTESIFD